MTDLPHQIVPSPNDALRIAVRINEASAALGISRSSLYELIAAGKLKTAVIAGRRVVPVTELSRLLHEALHRPDRD